MKASQAGHGELSDQKLAELSGRATWVIAPTQPEEAAVPGQKTNIFGWPMTVAGIRAGVRGRVLDFLNTVEDDRWFFDYLNQATLPADVPTNGR